MLERCGLQDRLLSTTHGALARPCPLEQSDCRADLRVNRQELLPRSYRITALCRRTPVSFVRESPRKKKRGLPGGRPRRVRTGGGPREGYPGQGVYSKLLLFVVTFCRSFNGMTDHRGHVKSKTSLNSFSVGLSEEANQTLPRQRTASRRFSRRGRSNPRCRRRCRSEHGRRRGSRPGRIDFHWTGR